MPNEKEDKGFKNGHTFSQYKIQIGQFLSDLMSVWNNEFKDENVNMYLNEIEPRLFELFKLQSKYHNLHVVQAGIEDIKSNLNDTLEKPHHKLLFEKADNREDANPEYLKFFFEEYMKS